MRILPVTTYTSQIKRREDECGNFSFGHSNQLKTLWKKGKLPSVEFDVMGRRLTKKNVTLDHIIPKSKGGKNITENYMLATKDFNHMRGNEPLRNYIFANNLVNYLNQFINVRVDHFIGNKYIQDVLATLKRAEELGL